MIPNGMFGLVLGRWFERSQDCGFDAGIETGLQSNATTRNSKIRVHQHSPSSL
jgi:hypothetical protein